MEGDERKKSANPHIPDDIIFIILCKLPPKALVRCKFVYMSWKGFVDRHKYHTRKLILHSVSFVQFVDFEADDEIKAIDLDTPFKGTGSHIMFEIASCNGLLCVYILSKGFVVWNPILERYKWIPPSLTPSRSENFGFWYDHSTNNYMIVRLIYFDDYLQSSPFLVEIYSQSTNIWQPKETLSSAIVFIQTYSGFLVKDAVYWMIVHVIQYPKVYIGVLCYDTVQATFDVILPPDNVRSFEILDDINRHLCIAHRHENIFHLWAREVGMNQSWFKLTSLEPFGSIASDYFRVICFVEKEEILINVREKIFLFKPNRRNQFLFYNPEANTYKEFQISHINLKFNKGITYAESLVLP